MDGFAEKVDRANFNWYSGLFEPENARMLMRVCKKWVSLMEIVNQLELIAQDGPLPELMHKDGAMEHRADWRQVGCTSAGPLPCVMRSMPGTFVGCRIHCMQFAIRSTTKSGAQNICRAEIKYSSEPNNFQQYSPAKIC